MSDEQQTIYVWHDRHLVDMWEFKQWFILGNESDPTKYPERLSPEEWDKRFEEWRNLKDER